MEQRSQNNAKEQFRKYILNECLHMMPEHGLLQREAKVKSKDWTGDS
jgi:hypothetical protein